ATSSTTSSARNPIPPDTNGRKLLYVKRTRYAPAIPASAPQTINALIALRVVGTPSSSAERGFLPVARSCKPHRVPRSAKITKTMATSTSSSASKLTGNSLLIGGSSDGAGNGAVDCALPPSGGCHGPEIR